MEWKRKKASVCVYWMFCYLFLVSFNCTICCCCCFVFALVVVVCDSMKFEHLTKRESERELCIECVRCWMVLVHMSESQTYEKKPKKTPYIYMNCCNKEKKQPLSQLKLLLFFFFFFIFRNAQWLYTITRMRAKEKKHKMLAKKSQQQRRQQ